jgi:energy-coupling factor transporter ATP-binding protein EcfA2
MMIELTEVYETKEYNFSTSVSNQSIIVEEVNDAFMMIIRSGVKGILIIDVYAKDISIAEDVFNLTKKYEDSPSMTTIKIVSFSMGGNGQLEKSTTTKNQDDFKHLSKLYYPFLDTDEMFKQYLISNDNLLLLAGSSGSGKTKIIDMLLDFSIKNESLLKDDNIEEDEDDSIIVAYVKNPNILASDSFWNTLSKSNFTYILLDDMDFIMTDRNINSETHNDDIRLRFISNFLSYTDGIFSTNTKFIITTNQSVDNIDPAILRKGRCFDVLSFRSLTNSEAKDVWLEAELPVEKFTEEFPINIQSITAADLGSKIEMYINLNIRNTTIKSHYIREDGISLYRSSFNKKIKI